MQTLKPVLKVPGQDPEHRASHLLPLPAQVYYIIVMWLEMSSIGNLSVIMYYFTGRHSSKIQMSRESSAGELAIKEVVSFSGYVLPIGTYYPVSGGR